MSDRDRRTSSKPKGSMVPAADFQSYYGRSVLKAPVWHERDIAGYFFLGGLAGGSALLAAGADLTGRPALRRIGRVTALGSISLSMAALVNDLGRPARFVHMLRVVKVTSPMSVGTWLLVGFTPSVAVAAAGEVADRLPLPAPLRSGVAYAARPAGLSAAAFAPFVVTYTGALIADTAVPLWHDAHRHLPYLFGAGALSAAGGVAAAVAPADEAGPARRMAVLAAAADVGSTQRMERDLGMVGEPLRRHRAGTLMTVARWATVGGAATLAVAGGRGPVSRAARALGGTALAVGSLAMRLGVFAAGRDSATDPKYTVVPQRERLSRRQS